MKRAKRKAQSECEVEEIEIYIGFSIYKAIDRCRGASYLEEAQVFFGVFGEIRNCGNYF